MLNRGFVCWRCQSRALQRSKPATQTSWPPERRASTIAQSKLYNEEDQTGNRRVRRPVVSRRSIQDRDNGESRLLELFLDGNLRTPRPRPPASHISPPSPGLILQNEDVESGRTLPLLTSEIADTSVQHDKKSIANDGLTDTAPAANLDELLRESAKLESAWVYFLKYFGRAGSLHRSHPAYQDLHHLRENAVFGKMLLAITKAWAAQPLSKLPPPSLILQKLEEVSAINSTFYVEAGWELIEELISLEMTRAKDVPTSKHDDLVVELLEIWASIFNIRGRRTNNPHISDHGKVLDWKDLEVRARRLLDEGLRPANSWVEARFEKLLNQESIYPRGSLSSLALASYDMISQHSTSLSFPSTHREHSVAFIRVLAIVIHRRPVDLLLKHIRERMPKAKSKQSSRARASYINRLANLPKFTYTSLAQKVQLDPTTVAVDDNDAESKQSSIPSQQQRIRLRPGAEKMFALLIKNAGKHQYGSRLDNVWENIVKCYSNMDKSAKNVKIPLHIYRLILGEFLALHKTNMADKVTKFMVRNGESLTVKEYTAMMDGCKRGKDFQSVEKLWGQMKGANVQPDYQAWNARISAMLGAGLQREAIETLDAMQAAWLYAVKKHGSSQDSLMKLGDMPDAVKPHIVNVNAVLSGFAKGSKSTSKFCDDMLKWASNIGLKPDAVTYTILVQLATARSDFKKAAEYLEQMAAAGIAPSAELFSVILHDSFRRTVNRQMTKEESEQRALSVISRLEQYGWNKNKVIFQILVDHLLKKHANYDAAMAVVRYMARVGIEPPEHMYTAFITHYFAQDPPNIEAVDFTVQRMTGPGMKGTVDNYLFDRIVEGYARCGEVEKIRYVLRRLSNQGRKSSWSALNEALDAFANAERYDLVQEMVVDFEKRKLLRWAEHANKSFQHQNAVEAEFLTKIKKMRAEILVAGDKPANTPG